jgi:hypothetical protein
LPHDHAANPGQANWRFCHKCFGLFFDDPQNSYKGRCPAGGPHVRASNSYNFQLPFSNEWINAPTAAARPTISVSIQNSGVFEVSGSGFLPRKTVYIRVADDDLTNSDLFLSASANATGSIRATFSIRCNPGFRLYFSANDGRSDRRDITGTFWSNTVQIFCR